jgi:hypothetical protein
LTALSLALSLLIIAQRCTPALIDMFPNGSKIGV